MVTVELPNCPPAGVSVNVRSATLPLKATFELGSRAVLYDIAVTPSAGATVSTSQTPSHCAGVVVFRFPATLGTAVSCGRRFFSTSIGRSHASAHSRAAYWFTPAEMMLE